MLPEALVYVGSSEIECAVLSASILHGRDDPGSQPDASTATIELVGALPAAAVMGARVRLVGRFAGVDFDRFVGEITDLGSGWDSVDAPTGRIIAAGDLGRCGRRYVGDVPWPAELDGARVNRVLGLAGFTPPPARTDPGTLTVLARDVDRQPALAVAQDAASDGGGIVWQNRAGELLYADAEHRRNAPRAMLLEACQIGLSAQWAQTLEGLCNDATVSYGPTPSGGEQPTVHATDAASITARGTYAGSLKSSIADAANAQARAELIVARQAVPAWIFEGLELELGAVDEDGAPLFDAADTATVLGLDVHARLGVTGLPEGGPASSAELWLEGWRESIEPGAWTLALATSDYCRTAAYARWDEVPAAVSWDTIDPALTWDKATCFPPQPSRGRWDDTPASLRWDTIPASVTWDSWPY